MTPLDVDPPMRKDAIIGFNPFSAALFPHDSSFSGGMNSYCSRIRLA